MAGKNRTSSSTTAIADERALSGHRYASRNSTSKNYAIAAVGEFFGTFLFFTTAYIATQSAKNNVASPESEPIAKLLYISFAFALALTVNVWLFYRVSGGIFNPALTFALVVIRLMPPAKGVLLAAAQLLGGIAAAGVAKALVPGGNLAVQTDLGTGVTTAQGLFIEFFLTAELALAVLMIAVEKHRATFMAPLVIGVALGIGHLVGVSFTGASMNPARSFGPAVVDGHFQGSHWIYWVGPMLGATAAGGLYKGLLAVDYRSANPGQDADQSVFEEATVFVDGATGEGPSRA